MLAAHPELTRSSIYVAAAAGDEVSVRAQVAADPALASREGSPYRREPLLYPASARHDPGISEEATLGTARALLERGGDPNAGYLWHGLYPPYTAAACALGSHDEDAHLHAFALAELLLTAGADANDGQLLHDRQFGHDDRHLVLLFEHDLGRGDCGPLACGPATRPTHRARCCAGSCGGRSCTTCATGSGCWSSTASTSVR